MLPVSDLDELQRTSTIERARSDFSLNGTVLRWVLTRGEGGAWVVIGKGAVHE
jgi:hypothetical protein